MALNAISLALPGTKAWMHSSIGHGTHKNLNNRSYQNTGSLGDDHVTCGTQLDAIINQSNIQEVAIIVPLVYCS